jgi:HK97 family phage major capsid protein
MKFVFTSKSTYSEFLTYKKVSADDEKDVEKMAGIHLEFIEGLQSAIEEADKNKVDATQLDAMKKELTEAIEKQRDATNQILKEQGIALKRVLQSSNPERKESLTAQIRKNLEGKKESLTKLKTSKDGGFDFVVKADTMTFASSITGEIPQAQLITGVDNIPTRMPVFLASLARRAATSNLIKWVSKVNKMGTAGVTGEGVLKNQISFEFVTGSTEIKKVTAFIKVSTEMLDDIDYLMSEIEGELFTELLLAVEAETYSGDGTGDNLEGIKTVATTFNGGGLTTTEPNIVDVLVAASNQIEIANQPEPTYAFLNPTVVNQLKLDKVSSTDRRYVERLSMIAGNLLLDGQVRIVKTTLLGANEFLIGNFGAAGFALLYEKGGISMDIGLENDDFTKNLRTILAEWRGASMVQTNKRNAFVKGNIDTALALIETT